MAPELRPPEGSGVEVGNPAAPDVVDDALVDVEVEVDEDEFEVGDGIPVVGNARGVDEEVGVDVVVVLAGTSDALKLSWYSGAKRT